MKKISKELNEFLDSNRPKNLSIVIGNANAGTVPTTTLTLYNSEKHLMLDALSFYYHHVVNRLNGSNLGDIERRNLEYEKTTLRDLIEKLK